MIGLRWFLILVMVFCLTASFVRGQFDGVSLIGVFTFVVFLATFPALRTRSFWVGADGVPSLSLECHGGEHGACALVGGCRNCGCHQAARIERAA